MNKGTKIIILVVATLVIISLIFLNKKNYTESVNLIDQPVVITEMRNDGNDYYIKFNKAELIEISVPAYIGPIVDNVDDESYELKVAEDISVNAEFFYVHNIISEQYIPFEEFKRLFEDRGFLEDRNHHVNYKIPYVEITVKNSLVKEIEFYWRP